MLSLDTSSRVAFQKYNLAKRKVSLYESTLDYSNLDLALQVLDDAIAADRNYFKPANFKGIVYDMKGQSIEAIQQFDLVLNQNLPSALRNETEYNKAVASYHQYSEKHIQNAISILEPLDNKLSPKDYLCPLVKAVLSQCYGMMVFHLAKKGSQQVDEYFKKNREKADEALSQVQKLYNKKHSIINEVRWIANNAKGISLMFLDDQIRDTISENNSNSCFQNLKKALQFFDKASSYSPFNWAITCNQGSVCMRLGHLFLTYSNDSNKAAEYFEKSESFFNKVITSLRPNYDFALFELGRISRFKTKLAEENKAIAIDYFDKAIQSGLQNPNVAKERIIVEREAAEKGIVLFNLAVLSINRS